MQNHLNNSHYNKEESAFSVFVPLFVSIKVVDVSGELSTLIFALRIQRRNHSSEIVRELKVRKQEKVNQSGLHIRELPEPIPVHMMMLASPQTLDRVKAAGDTRQLGEFRKQRRDEKKWAILKRSQYSRGLHEDYYRT